MTPEQAIAEVARYESELDGIRASFKETRNGIYIARGDEAFYRQYVRELVDLYNDILGGNSYSAQIAHEFSHGFGSLGSPLLRGVENILAVVRASLTRLRRNPELLEQKKTQEATRKKENIFLRTYAN